MKVQLLCPINPTGYGIHGSNMALALNKRHDVDLSVIPIGNVQPVIPEAARLPFAQRSGDNIINIQIWHEHSLRWVPSGKNIAFPVWEVDSLPQTSVDALAQFDLVLVPSKYHQEVLSKYGIFSEVVPEGFDPEYFYPRPSPQPVDKQVRFCHVGKAEARKSTFEIIETFANTFTPEEATLHVAVENPFLQNHPVVDHLNALIDEHPHVIKDGRIYLGPQGIAELYNSCHVAVFCPKAEGWGLPILEAMACGLHTISTRVTAMADYYPENPLEVTTHGKIKAMDGLFFRGQGDWYLPDYHSLSASMKLAADMARENPKSNLMQEAASKFTWDAAGQALVDVLNKHASGLLKVNPSTN